MVDLGTGSGDQRGTGIDDGVDGRGDVLIGYADRVEADTPVVLCLHRGVRYRSLNFEYQTHFGDSTENLK